MYKYTFCSYYSRFLFDLKLMQILTNLSFPTIAKRDREGEMDPQR